jgi:hypothetical protein
MKFSLQLILWSICLLIFSCKGRDPAIRNYCITGTLKFDNYCLDSLGANERPSEFIDLVGDLMVPGKEKLTSLVRYSRDSLNEYYSFCVRTMDVLDTNAFWTITAASFNCPTNKCPYDSIPDCVGKMISPLHSVHIRSDTLALDLRFRCTCPEP